MRWAGGESQLERECFSMAGGERGCRLVQNEGLQGELLEVMVDFVSGGEDLKRVEDGQPFRLGLIKATTGGSGGRGLRLPAGGGGRLPAWGEAPAAQNPGGVREAGGVGSELRPFRGM